MDDILADRIPRLAAMHNPPCRHPCARHRDPFR